MGECATAATGAGSPDGPIQRENSPEWGLSGSAACGFFDWNTYFVVFSGGVEQRLGGLKAQSSWNICQNGGLEARRLDLAGAFTLPAAGATAVSACGTQADLYKCRLPDNYSVSFFSGNKC